MFFFFISCLSFFLFLYKSLSLPSLPPWARQTRLLSVPRSSELLAFRLGQFMASLPSENQDSAAEMSILDLPELAVEIILGKLSAAALCRMSGVCSSLRARCRSDHLWRRHLENKWGALMDSSASQRAWKSFLTLNKEIEISTGRRSRWLGALYCLWPLSWLTSKINFDEKYSTWFPDDSIMAWYLAIESGRFSFPAQVFNRENGHLGFMLSCYDAELKYDARTDTFAARYTPHGRRKTAIEEGVTWERIRAPPVETQALDLHDSSCLADLRPGDHVEVQWRRNKEFPYGWWYGVVGHLGACDGDELHCHCHDSDAVVLEFNQYAEGSRWRRATLSRKNHREAGNEMGGFYGGVRKLRRKGEIAAWRRLWPAAVLG